MKPAFIITAIFAAAATIGTWQNSRLSHLKQQSVSLETRATQPVSVRSPRSPEPTVKPISQAEQDAFCEQVITELLAHMEHSNRDVPDQAERRRNWLLTSAKFSAADIERCLQKLRADPRLAGSLNETETIQLCLQVFAETGPFAAMKFLEGHREMPEWAAHYAVCFNGFLVANPRDAIRWFDEQTALGNPDIANSSVRQSILIRESRIDPDKMLARAISPAFTSDPETLTSLGGFVASTLKEPSEHQQFLAALRRMQKGGDLSPEIGKIRAEYIGGLSQKFYDFRFEESSAMVDSEFTLDEKLAFVTALSNFGELEEPVKWADWLLEIDFPTWENRNANKGTEVRHPALRVLSNWVRQDYQAAEKWLENVPGGPLKSAMSMEYASSIAGIDPLHAVHYLPQLPEGKTKTNLIQKIAEALDLKDPDAATAFRAENLPTKK